jgi:hypothetical protein
MDLISPEAGYEAAYKPIYDLACAELRDLGKKLKEIDNKENLDPYSKSHVRETGRLIEKALDASIVLDVKSGRRGGGGMIFRIGNEPQTP